MCQKLFHERRKKINNATFITYFAQKIRRYSTKPRKKSVKIIKQEVTFKITLKTKIQTQLEAAALELQWLRSWAPPAGYCSGLLTRCARLAKTPLYNYITLLKWEPFYFLQLFLIVAGVLFRYLGCGLYCAVEKRCGCRDKCMASSCSVFFLVWSCCSD